MRRFLGAMILALTVLLACASAEGPAVSISRGMAADLTAGADTRELTIPEGVVRIEAEAFAGTGLELVTLPKSLESIADNAFDDGVKFVVYANSYAESWADETWAQEPDHRIIRRIIDGISPDIDCVIDENDPEGRYYIKQYFGSDETVVLPADIGGKPIYRIAESAFANSSVKEIVLPETLEYIDDYAFLGCSQLISIDLPVGLVSIGYHAFENCESLQAIEIPETVTDIGTWAFANCLSLERVVFPTSLKNTIIPVFKNCTSMKELTIAINMDYTATVFEGSTNVEIIHYLAGDSSAFNKHVHREPNCLEYVCKRSLKEIYFGEGITEIGEQAFSDNQYESPALCSVLEHIHFPSSLQTIGEQAFYGQTNLTSVSFPDGLKRIGSKAFSHCMNLVKPELPSTLECAPDAFEGCQDPE